MKKYILLISLVMLFAGSIDAQRHRHRWGMRHHDKIEELKKMKLIEVLDMDEETSVRFFERRKDHQERMMNLMNERDSLLNQIDEKLKDDAKPESFNNLINQLNKIEVSIAEERRTFFNSLNDILNKKQVAKVIVFEHEFHQKLRDLMMKRRMGGPQNMKRPGF